ncbi:MAG: HAMP domain-containing sensor histidine kinase [bacterium]
MVFVAIVVATLSIGAFVITQSVTRAGLTDLFRQRFEQAARVLAQYGRSHQLMRMNELESVLTSPRFLAALETGDPATVADNVPSHGVLADADFVLITSPAGDVLDRSRGIDDAMLARLRALPASADPAALPFVNGDRAWELVVAPVDANNGQTLGRVVIGTSLEESYAEALRALTGFEVLVSLGDRPVARTDGLQPAHGTALAALPTLEEGRVVPVVLGGEKALAYRVVDSESGISVTFVGSVDRAIAPTMARVQRLLLLLAVCGSALAVGVVYVFARRRVGRQIAGLVSSAERIAAGDLDFRISPQSSDELGYVAGEFEKMRAQLRANRDALEAAHVERLNSERLAALGRMATGIIHDFKNPMAVVLGTADLIRVRDAANEKLGKQCHVIRAQIERMSALTRDVLEYARGHTVLEPATIDLGAWLAEVVEGHREAATRAGVRLALEATPGVGVMIDPGRMRRVIDNLLTNAREASRVGDVVTVAVHAAAAGDVRIDVRDQGVGIPPEVAKTLFEPFVTAGKEGGSGLGLAISKKIVEDHGASIAVESQPEKGACFRVTLPAKLRVDGGREAVREEVLA